MARRRHPKVKTMMGQLALICALLLTGSSEAADFIRPHWNVRAANCRCMAAR
jgi:hypothetical protein